jgi:hypothetical protein
MVAGDRGRGCRARRRSETCSRGEPSDPALLHRYQLYKRVKAAHALPFGFGPNGSLSSVSSTTRTVHAVSFHEPTNAPAPSSAHAPRGIAPNRLIRALANGTFAIRIVFILSSNIEFNCCRQNFTNTRCGPTPPAGCVRSGASRSSSMPYAKTKMEQVRCLTIVSYALCASKTRYRSRLAERQTGRRPTLGYEERRPPRPRRVQIGTNKDRKTTDQCPRQANEAKG